MASCIVYFLKYSETVLFPLVFPISIIVESHGTPEKGLLLVLGAEEGEAESV